MERRRDDKTRDRIDWIVESLERAIKRQWIAMVIFFVGMIIGGFFIWERGREINDARYDSAFNACVSSNERHDGTIRQLHVEVKKIKRSASPKQKRAVEASLQANIRLINVMIPAHKDRRGHSTCGEYAAKVQNGEPAGPSA